MEALSIAATGMTAQQLNVEVIANNIANMNTTAFKRARAEFTDLLYQTARLQGVPNQTGEDPIPEGAQRGLGVRSAAIRKLHLQGTLSNTGNNLDLAIDGRGWFEIQNADGDVFYTRSGAFNTNGSGRLVTIDGYPLEPPIVVPENAINTTINASGQVFVQIQNETAPRLLGQLQLTNFANDAGLEAVGDNLFRQTEASGEGLSGPPASEGFGRIRQGYLEDSNVDPVTEITALIAAQRGYEMNSKVIQTVDQMSSTVTKGIR